MAVAMVLSVAMAVTAADTRHAAAANENLVPINPARLLDTRTGDNISTVDGQYVGAGRVPAGTAVALQVGGRGGVANDAGTVMLNVTAVAPDRAGFVTVFPCESTGDERPQASHLNYFAGATAPNSVLAKVGPTGMVCLFSLAGTDLIADATGYVPSGGAPVSITPARFLETRPGEQTFDGQHQGVGRLGAGDTVRFNVAGRGLVPANTDAVYLNVTAIYPDTAGFLTVYPCGSARPDTSNVNYGEGDVTPNAVLATIGDAGDVCVYSRAAADVIVDVNGFFPPGGGRVAIDPARCADTRTPAEGGNTFDGEYLGRGKLDPDETWEIEVAGRCHIADDASAAYLNVTAVDPDGAGFLTVWPCDEARPTTSNVNYLPGQTQPNAVLSKISLSGAGSICVYSKARTHVIVDVNGFVPNLSPPTTTTTVPSDTTPDTTPEPTAGISDFSVGKNHACALRAEQEHLWCWGNPTWPTNIDAGKPNASGILGIDQADKIHQTMPIRSPGLSDIKAIRAGAQLSCAIRDDDTVWCWGEGDDGGLGNNSEDDQIVAVPTGVSAADVIDVGHKTGCAVTDDGRLWCWGYSNSDSLIPGDSGSKLVPAEVTGFPDPVVDVTIGGNGFTKCALLDTAELWCWGYHPYESPTIQAPHHLASDVLGVSLGDTHGCLVDGDGDVSCWGTNLRGQLGNGTISSGGASDYVHTPERVPGLSNAVAVAAGGHSSCAVLDDGTAQCWGANDNGQLGNGADSSSRDDEPSPVDVVVPAGRKVVDADVGFEDQRSCFLLDDTNLACAGHNANLGLGRYTADPDDYQVDDSTPRPVDFPYL